MSIYLFPGQGSQVKGMGETLFSEFPDITAIADDILGYSIAEVCLMGDERLHQTQYTQPALYTVNALTYFKKIRELPRPLYTAGHSLGEYNALLAAEVFDFATGLKLVQKRGELMSKADNGGMAAIIGLTSDKVQEILINENLSTITIANYNSYTQIVIAGPKNAIISAQALFENAGASLYIPLKVSGAFHSPLMQPAQEAFTQFLNQFTFAEPCIPVIANVNANPYRSQEIASLLAQQITSSVQWTTIIETFLKQGINDFLEVGPGTILTGLIRRIQNGQ